MNETLKRGISGAVYVALLIGATLYSKESFLLLFGLFLLIATYEFSSLIKINKVYSLLISIILYSLIVIVSYYKTEFENYFNNSFSLQINLKILNVVILVVAILVSIKSILFLFFDKPQPISTSSKFLYLLGYIILPFILITKISFGVSDYNPKIIIGLFILIWTNDTFAYLVGKSIGKNKLYEKISPKKTIEGFVGGVIFAILAGILISKYFIQASESHSRKSIIIWISLAVIVGVFGTIGDLVESKFKRIAGVKDSGKIMPGHGGILDRLDSLIFVAPIIFLYYQILSYVS